MTLTYPFITLAIGIAIGWAIRHAQTLARFRRETMWLDKQALDFKKFAAEHQQTSVLLQAADADTDLDLLAFLDNGQVSDAKKFLIHKLGLFYRSWTARPAGEAVPESIEKSLSAIKQAAKSLGSVQAVLTYRPDDAKPTA